MGQFDDYLARLADQGVDDEIINGLRDASGVRKELEDERTKRKAAGDQAQQYRGALLKAQFAKHDVRLNPNALNMPDNLDPTDDQAVADWLVEAGAIEAKPAVPDETFEAQERVASASNGAQNSQTAGVIAPPDVAGWSADKWGRFQKEHPEAAEQLKRGEEVQGIAF